VGSPEEGLKRDGRQDPEACLADTAAREQTDRTPPAAGLPVSPTCRKRGRRTRRRCRSQFGSARQAFFELAQARPRAADAWFNFGTASWQLNDTSAAIIGWQRAMRLDPMTSDVRELLRLGPGTPRLWHDVPPVTLTVLGAIGGSFWLAGFLLMAFGRRRRHVFLNRLGASLAIGAVLLLLGGIKQREKIDGRDDAVVLSSARLRAMPVLSSEAGIEAQPGEVVRILGHQGAWMRVELTDRRRGWVEAQRLQALAHAEATFSIAR